MDNTKPQENQNIANIPGSPIAGTPNAQTAPSPQQAQVNSQPPTIQPNQPEGKNKGLIIVAVILTLLIAILAVLYFVILQQSQTPEPTQQTPPVQTPTPEASPTPIDEVQETEGIIIEDPLPDLETIDREMNVL